MFEIDREHPEYRARKAMWRVYRDLVRRRRTTESECVLKDPSRRQKEPADVYNERLSRAFYENYIGSIVDWYAATLFRREPFLTFTGDAEAAKTFLCEFTEDCDRKRVRPSEFFRRQLTEALVSGAAYILVDFPRAAGSAANRAEEDADGSVSSVPGGVLCRGPNQLGIRRAR